MGKKKDTRRRLQVSVTKTLHTELVSLSVLEDRDVAWVCGHLISLSLGNEGKKSFGRWLAKRIIASASNAKRFRQVASGDQIRIHVVVNKVVNEDLAAMAERMDCTPVKLVGLLLDHGVDTHAVWFRIFSTRLGGLIRRLANGSPNEDPPLHELPIGWKDLPWMGRDAPAVDGVDGGLT